MISATDPLLFLLEKYYEITLSQILHTIKVLDIHLDRVSGAAV